MKLKLPLFIIICFFASSAYSQIGEVSFVNTEDFHSPETPVFQPKVIEDTFNKEKQSPKVFHEFTNTQLKVDKKGVMYIRATMSSNDTLINSLENVYFAQGYGHALAKAGYSLPTLAMLSCRVTQYIDQHNNDSFESLNFIKEVSKSLLNSDKSPTHSNPGPFQDKTLTDANKYDLMRHISGLCKEDGKKRLDSLPTKTKRLFMSYVDGYNHYLDNNVEKLVKEYPHFRKIYETFRLTYEEAIFALGPNQQFDLTRKKILGVLDNQHTGVFSDIDRINVSLPHEGASNAVFLVGKELPNNVLSQVETDPHTPIGVEDSLRKWIPTKIEIVDSSNKQLYLAQGFSYTNTPGVALGATKNYANAITAAAVISPPIFYARLDKNNHNQYIDVNGTSQNFEKKRIIVGKNDAQKEIQVNVVPNWGTVIYKNTDTKTPHCFILSDRMGKDHWATLFIELNLINDGSELVNVFSNSDGTPKVSMFNFLMSAKSPENPNKMEITHYLPNHIPKWKGNATPTNWREGIIPMEKKNFITRMHRLDESEYAYLVDNAHFVEANAWPQRSWDHIPGGLNNAGQIDRENFYGTPDLPLPNGRWLSHWQCVNDYLIDQQHTSENSINEFTRHIGICNYNNNAKTMITHLNKIIHNYHWLLLTDNTHFPMPKELHEKAKLIIQIMHFFNSWDYTANGDSQEEALIMHFLKETKSKVEVMKNTNLKRELEQWLTAVRVSKKLPSLKASRYIIDELHNALFNYIDSFGHKSTLSDIVRLPVKNQNGDVIQLKLMGGGSGESANVANVALKNSSDFGSLSNSQNKFYEIFHGSSVTTTTEHYVDGTFTTKFRSADPAWDHKTGLPLESAKSFAQGDFQSFKQWDDLTSDNIYFSIGF